MPAIIAAALTPIIGTGALTIGAFSITFAQIGGYLLYSVATSALLRALAPSTDSGTANRGTYVNGRVATGPHAIVYGQVRVTGPITYIETVDNNENLLLCIPLAGHEVEEIGDIYLNDEIVTLDGSGNVTDTLWKTEGGATTIRISKHLGTAAQVADADLLLETEDVNVDANFRGRGIAYLYVKMDFDQDVFAQGIPAFSAVVKGKKCFDPRDSSTTWTANSALCLYDYLTSEYGLAADSAELDATLWGAQATICDEAVTLDAGGTQDRYTTNGVFYRDAAPSSTIPELLSACAGSLFWSQGWKLKVGYYVAPTVTLDWDDLRSAVQISTRVSRRERINSIRGTFLSADDDWIGRDFPPVESATFLSEDDAVENVADIRFPFITNSPQAQRVAKIMLYRAREQITFSAEWGLAAFNLAVGDTVNITLDRYGWSAKVFEVMEWQLIRAQDGDLRAHMVLRETSAAVYSWTAEETTFGANDSTLTPLTPPEIDETTEVTVVATGWDDGLGFKSFDVEFTIASASPFVAAYALRYRSSATEGEWRFSGFVISGVIDVRDVASINKIDGREPHKGDDLMLELQFQAINSLGQVGPWSGSLTWSVVNTGSASVPNARAALALDTTNAVTFAAATVTSDITLTGNILHSTSTGSIVISGGSSSGLGARVAFRGESHASQAGDVLFADTGGTWFHWDDSAAALALTGDVDITGNLTADGGTFQLGVSDTTAGLLQIFGNAAGAEGGEIRLYMAAAHDTSIDFAFFDAFQDDMRIGRQGLTYITLKGSEQYVLLSTPYVTPGYTVAGLPSGVTGMRAHVTDASSPTWGSAASGGGASIVPVFYNGSSWIVG